jgi:lysyl-tRNA synthetase class 2
MEELRQSRLQKMHEMKAAGVNPYSYKFAPTTNSAAIKQNYEALNPGEEDADADVSVAGRVMMKRIFGKLAFFTLQDAHGQIQLYLDKSRLGDSFQVSVNKLVGEKRMRCTPTNHLCLLLFHSNPQQLKDWLDAGDIIGVRGSVKRTEKGEMSVYVREWQMLTKSLLPMPDKWHGLTDVNKRYRQRHLDLIVNPQVKQTFVARAKMTSSLRRRLDDLGFVEIETPILQTSPGGADAKPFETYHNALEMNLTLRIATELHLKRLMIGGFDKGKVQTIAA